MLASSRHGTLYVGVTSDLMKRIHQHRTHSFAGFTAKYKVDRLVWFESYVSVEAAIVREKRIKEWQREWKINLLEATNPGWSDLAVGLGCEPLPNATRPFRTLDETDQSPPHPLDCHPGEGRDL